MKHRSFLRSKSDQAAAKLCAKWNCVNNSNNLLANAFPHLE